jgi:predicted nucleic acid-binding protein
VALVYFDASALVKLVVDEEGSELALRGADAIHLASALAVGDAELLMAAWDRRLSTAARAAGLAVTPPPN